MKRICAWCGKDMGETVYTGELVEMETHGICESCIGWVPKTEDDLYDHLSKLMEESARLTEHIRRRRRHA